MLICGPLQAEKWEYPISFVPLFSQYFTFRKVLEKNIGEDRTSSILCADSQVEAAVLVNCFSKCRHGLSASVPWKLVGNVTM